MSQQTVSDSRSLTPDLSAAGIGRPIVGLWRLSAGYRLALAGVVITLGLSVLARTGTYLVIRYFIDDFLVDPSASANLWLIAGGFVLLTALQGAFAFIGGTLAAHGSEGIIQRLRNFLLNHIQRLPFSYHDGSQTGDLVQRVTSDVDAVRRFLALEVVASSRIIFLFLINFIAILFLNWRLGLISVVVIPIVLGISVFFFRLVSRAYDEYQKQEAVLTTALQENLTGVRVVKAFARQEYEQDKFEDANFGKYKRGKHLLLMHSMYWPVSDVLCGIQTLVGLVVGAVMAINGTISVGTYVAYSGMVVLIIWPMRNLGRLVVEMSRGLVSFGRIASMIRAEEEPLDECHNNVPEAVSGDIAFQNVCFVYDTDKSAYAGSGTNSANGKAPPGGTLKITEPEATNENNADGTGIDSVDFGALAGNGRGDTAAIGAVSETVAGRRKPVAALQDITFHVKGGERVALLGGTGAGKTSLVNLLPRFYNYTSGSITLDGVELRDYSRRHLRSLIGIVEQEPFLFSRTVRDNITYGVGRDVSQEEVEEAAKAAAIHDVILEKLPEGYDTLVGERGATLSGGQKQRIAIARTLLKDPRILILDDSTSSVDTETEAAIRQALERLMTGRTTFIIAHRIQSVMNADLILVLNQGRIEQDGTHDELVRQEGMYQRIYQAQTRIEDELQKELSRDSTP